MSKEKDPKPGKEEPDKNLEPDFYWENGLLVFTASYHLKRGYCCKSGCRHCPYGFKASDGSGGNVR